MFRIATKDRYSLSRLPAKLRIEPTSCMTAAVHVRIRCWPDRILDRNPIQKLTFQRRPQAGLYAVARGHRIVLSPHNPR
jgi:hypothetical protein